MNSPHSIYPYRSGPNKNIHTHQEASINQKTYHNKSYTINNIKNVHTPINSNDIYYPKINSKLYSNTQNKDYYKSKPISMILIIQSLVFHNIYFHKFKFLNIERNLRSEMKPFIPI